MEERGLSILHHGMGRSLRNRWELWGGDSSRLLKWFHDKTGLQHPDDISNIIIVSFWRHLHSQPVDLEGQVEPYKQYWGEKS